MAKKILDAAEETSRDEDDMGQVICDLGFAIWVDHSYGNRHIYLFSHVVSD